MDFNVEWNITLRDGSKRKLAKLLRASCLEYFGKLIPPVTLRVLALKGQETHNGIAVRMAPDHLVNREWHKGGVPTYVRGEGKKCMLAYLTIDGMSPEEIRECITMGPLAYNRQQAQGGASQREVDQNTHATPAEVSEVGADPQSAGAIPAADEYALLRLFWDTILNEFEAKAVAGHIELSIKELSTRAQKDLGMEDNQYAKCVFFRTQVRPFGERVQEGKKIAWKLDVSKLQDFVKGAQLPRLSRRSGAVRQQPEPAPKAKASKGHEPEAVLNELEELLARIETVRTLKEEEASTRSVLVTQEADLKSLEGKLAEVERELDKLRTERDALRKALKGTRTQLDRIEAGLAKNAVSESTINRLRTLGILKGAPDGEDNVIKLAVVAGKAS